MVSITKWASAALIAGGVLVSSQALAITLGAGASVSFGGTYGYDGGAQELSVNLGEAFDGQAELQSVDGSTPVPNGFVFDLSAGADNSGDFFDLNYDRSQIIGSPSPGSETGTFRFTIDSIVSFDLAGMATSSWLIELDAVVNDLSASPVYDDNLIARVIIGGAALNATAPMIQVHISADGGVVSSASIPKAAPAVILVGGMAGLALVRRMRQKP